MPRASGTAPPLAPGGRNGNEMEGMLGRQLCRDIARAVSPRQLARDQGWWGGAPNEVVYVDYTHDDLSHPAWELPEEEPPPPPPPPQQQQQAQKKSHGRNTDPGEADAAGHTATLPSKLRWLPYT